MKRKKKPFIEIYRPNMSRSEFLRRFMGIRKKIPDARCPNCLKELDKHLEPIRITTDDTMQCPKCSGKWPEYLYCCVCGKAGIVYTAISFHLIKNGELIPATLRKIYLCTYCIDKLQPLIDRDPHIVEVRAGVPRRMSIPQKVLSSKNWSKEEIINELTRNKVPSRRGQRNSLEKRKGNQRPATSHL